MRVSDFPISPEELEPMIAAVLADDGAALPEWYDHIVLARLLGMPVTDFEFLLAQGGSVQVTPIGEWCRRVWLVRIAHQEAAKRKAEKTAERSHLAI